MSLGHSQAIPETDFRSELLAQGRSTAGPSGGVWLRVCGTQFKAIAYAYAYNIVGSGSIKIDDMYILV